MSLLKVCLVGASGRMGAEIIQAITEDRYSELCGATEREDSLHVGDEIYGAGGVRISSNLVETAAACDVIIDYSGAAGTEANIHNYEKAGKPVVIGSTGLSAADIDALKKLSKKIPVIQDTNMSVGVNVMNKIVELAAKIMDDSYDIEIFEAHHKFKKDAPSGTALTLGKAAAKGRGVDLNTVAVTGDRSGERKQGEIGFQVMRGGDIAGTHTVFFAGFGETLEITHRATNRSIFAKGALKAAKWLVKQPAGFYKMKDVLGL